MMMVRKRSLMKSDPLLLMMVMVKIVCHGDVGCEVGTFVVERESVCVCAEEERNKKGNDDDDGW
jgi:hypothetical protein